jgi:flagellar hook-associated protein 2
MTLSIGGKSANVAITASNNTVSGIANAINTQASSLGVTASVTSDANGDHLVLTSNTAGVSNTINVSMSNLQNDNGLSSLAVTSQAGTSTIASSGSVAWTQTQGAQDALFTVDGTTVSSASNSTQTAIAGVTLNLSAAAAGTTQTLTVATDTSAQSTAITNFVNLYNTLVTTMNTVSSFDPNSASSAQGPLLGDSTLNTIRNSLATTLSSGVKSGGSTLSLGSIGIATNADGTLTLDSTALNNALQSNPATVAGLFNSTNGVAAKLNKNLTSFLATGGVIDVRTTALNDDLTNIAKQQTTLSDYTTQLTNQYQAQFTALNTLMATMNNNSQYLTQLFGGTNSQGALSANKG